MLCSFPCGMLAFARNSVRQEWTEFLASGFEIIPGFALHRRAGCPHPAAAGRACSHNASRFGSRTSAPTGSRGRGSSLLSYTQVCCDPEIQSGKNGLNFLRPVLRTLPGFAPCRRAQGLQPAASFFPELTRNARILRETAGFNAPCVEFGACIHYNRP